MFSVLNIAGAIEQAVIDLIKVHKMDQWARLIFTMTFSIVVSLLGTTGAMLSAHRPVTESVGEGMVVAAVAATWLFRRSPLTKGMTVALPAAEAAAEIKMDMQVIERK